MTEMTAFERRVADGMLHRAGPVHPVDDLAIFESIIAASRQQRWGFTMFSALKFIAAAAIVALFGGFLLTGVFTMQQGDEMAPAAVTASSTAESEQEATQPPESPPSPMTAEELLSGMVTEEVESGVFRVVNDGVRGADSTWSVNVGYDGSVWLFTQSASNDEYHDRAERFLRLGSDETHQWPFALFWEHGFEVAPDGTIWVIRGAHDEYQFASSEGRRSTDGEEWTVQTCPQGRFCRGFAVAPDGTVWASWREEDGRWRVGHLGPTGWQPLDGYARNVIAPFRGYQRLFVTDAGDIYGYEVDGLFRYEDGNWEHIPGVDGLFDVGRDGTLWHYGENGLDRFADGEWARWTSADLPAISDGLALGHEPRVHEPEFMVAPDGNLWFGLWQQGADGDDPRLCDGLARFDGVTLDRFLRGQCLNSVDIGPDSSVWLRSDGDSLYVITPEAVAAE